VEGLEVKVVSPVYLRGKNIPLPDSTFGNVAQTIVFVIINNELAGFVSLSDEIRREAQEAIDKFKKNNIKVIMATGDNENDSKIVSNELGLDGYYAEGLQTFEPIEK
jgi:Cu2+-exporting ATPase